MHAQLQIVPASYSHFALLCLISMCVPFMLELTVCKQSDNASFVSVSARYMQKETKS